MKIDPICGMQVDEKTGLSAQRDGETFYFCGEKCRQKFLGQAGSKTALSRDAAAPSQGCCGSSPSEHRHEGPAHHPASHSGASSACCGSEATVVAKPEAQSCCGGQGSSEAVKPSAGAAYFCPMCPGVESDKPGDCPKCGMPMQRVPARTPLSR